MNKPARQHKTAIRPTPYGWMTVFLLFWLPLTAVFTANNFLLIIFIMMIGVVIVSHKSAKRNIESVTLTRRLPYEIYAETPFSIKYKFSSDQELWGAVTLSFREGPPLQSESDGVRISRVLPNETTVEYGHFTFPARGDWRLSAGTLHSSFPFGLASYSRACGDEASVLVFPRIQPVDDDIPIQLGGSGRGREHVDPLGTVPYLFRDYVPGDPHKLIDWKKSAQSGNLVTRILSEEGAREITLRLPRNASERAISRAASLIVHFGRSGTPVSLEGPGLWIGPGTGREFSRKLLTVLARWPDYPETGTDRDHSSRVLVEIDDSGDFLWMGRGDTDELQYGHLR
ncbi:MAG: DUF58 domain-containing protein [Desulfomonilaceae bacterium]|nr:DUF58 domain-containing protein [Desulfomonilaceae bacterium]